MSNIPSAKNFTKKIIACKDDNEAELLIESLLKGLMIIVRNKTLDWVINDSGTLYSYGGRTKDWEQNYDPKKILEGKIAKKLKI